MLYGEYQHNMDAKGRVTIPSKFREDLGDKFYICKGLDECLFMLSPEQWDKMLKEIATMPVVKARKVQRYYFSGAVEVEGDKQGRILIPPNLRDYAGIIKEVRVIGAGSRAEIWSSEKWDEYNDSLTQEDIELAMEALNI